jgi:hypothetical protein
MADSGLFIGFGAPVRGRERQATKVFNEAFEYYSRLQQDGSGGAWSARGHMESLGAVM